MNKYLLLIALVIALFSCKKKADTAPQPPSAYDYYPLKPGNYWVYEWFYTDTTGVYTGNSGPADSVVVRTDTVIRGNTYYILDDYNGSSLGGIFRDSSGYLVDIDGGIHFSSTNFTDVLHTDSLFGGTTLVGVFSWMMYNNVAAVTPAGNFATMQYKGAMVYNMNYGINPKYYMADEYARQTGLVLTHTFYENDPNRIIDIKLLRYHVQ